MGRDVLDVACGEGYGSRLLADVARSVVGVDINAAVVQHAAEKYVLPNLRFVQGNCVALPLESASFDVVVSFETIEHHDQHEAMMREIRRVLRPGGLVIMSSPNRPVYDQTLVEPNPYHVKELDEGEFVELLRTHFAHVALYGQRVAQGSFVSPHGQSEPGFVTLTERGAEERLARPVYFIALASDGVVPSLGSSLYEAPVAVPAAAQQPLEIRLYISERVDGVATPFGESRGAFRLYEADGRRQGLELVLPEDLAPLLRLRLDIASAPVAVRLFALSLVQPDGSLLWQWAGDCGAFAHPGGVLCLPAEVGVWLLCLNNDPQFELAIPEPVLAQVRAGARLQVEMAPKPLPEALPEVIDALQARAAQPPVVATARLPVGFANHMEDVAGLVQQVIARKNDLIATQKAQIDTLTEHQQALYDRLLRAEAQLELLKEIAFGSRLERL